MQNKVARISSFVYIFVVNMSTRTGRIYNETSMARTPLEP